MKPSIVTDEISADFTTAVELGTAWGIKDFELRGFGENRVPLLSDFQHHRVREALDAFNADLVAISPGLFKFPFPRKARDVFPVQTIDHAIYQDWQQTKALLEFQLNEVLPQSIRFAQEFDVRLIISFGFARGARTSKEPPEAMLETLYQAADLVGKADMKLALETEADFWADTGENTASLLEKIGHPALMVNWDPSNSYQAGERPFPDGYAHVSSRIAHVHYKDIVRSSDEAYTYQIEGQVDWAGQICALFKDGYTGHISVEPHMFPQVESAKASTLRLTALIDLAKNDG